MQTTSNLQAALNLISACADDWQLPISISKYMYCILNIRSVYPTHIISVEIYFHISSLVEIFCIILTSELRHPSTLVRLL